MADQIELIERTRAKTTDVAQIAEANAQRIDWTPLPGPQTMAYESPADELAYGGAAGGGKSFLLLGLAVTAHRNSIIFRREAQQMRGSDGLIAQSEQLIGQQGRLNRSSLIWRGLPGGRSLEFGSMPHEQNKLRYKGRPHDLKAFDEATEFTQSQYRFTIAWNRTTIPGQRCRVVLTFNPPTSPEGEWVIEEFAPWLDPTYPDPADPGELRWYCYGPGDRIHWFKGIGEGGIGNPGPVEIDGETYELKSRTFIPARLEDNPYLMEAGYARTLSALPEPLRSQLRYGSFEVQSDDDPYQVIPTAWVLAAQERFRQLHRTGVGPNDPAFTPGVPLTTLGVDVARGGRAETVLAPRFGNYIGPLQCYPGKSTPDGPAVAALILEALRPWPGAPAVVDVLGVGSGVEDALVANQVPFFAFDAGAASDATDRTGLLRMVNKRAEAWWRMRELLDPANGYDIALPDDRQLRADLCAPRYRLTVRGIQIESKEDLAKRIGRSTDRGDAVVMAFEDVPALDWVIR